MSSQIIPPKIDLDYLGTFGMINLGTRAVAIAAIQMVTVKPAPGPTITAKVMLTGGTVVELNGDEYAKFEKDMKDMAYNIRLSQMGAGKVRTQ